MPLFKRGKKDQPAEPSAPDEALARHLSRGGELLEKLNEAHTSWGLGSGKRWDLDQTTGKITFTLADKVATAPAQILGTYSERGGTWLWAWANESILPAMRRASEAVRDWALANDQPMLAAGKINADADLVNLLTAAALSITNAAGFYRGPGPNGSFTIITFGPTVEFVHADGTMDSMAINIREDD